MSRHAHWWVVSLLAFALAFLLRAAIPFANVFTIDGVNLQETDAWYHMRLIEGFLESVPALTQLDPHASFPHGQRVDVGPVLDLLVVAVVKLTGLDPWIAAAWCPVVLWVLLTGCLGLLARRLYSAEHGLVAVLVSCLLGGHFLRVTSLGFHDHHVLEALGYVLILLTLPGGRFWLAALCLWLYLLTFLGGALLIGFLILWRLITPAAPNLWRSYALALLLLAPFHRGLWVDYSLAMLLAALLLELLHLAVPQTRRRYLLIGLASVPLLAAAWHFGVFALARHFSASAGASTVNEMRHLTPTLLWQGFGVFAACALGGLAQLRLNATPAVRLAAVTGIGFFVTSCFQFRLTYYLAIPVALFSASLLVPLLAALARPVQLLAPVLLCLLAAPTLYTGYQQAQRNNGYGADWRDLFTWFRYQTPPAVPAAEAYPRLLPYNRDYRSTAAAYGVLAWWDYGYGFTTLAQRTPFTNPTQRNASVAAQIYLASSPAEFTARLREHRLPYAVFHDGLAMLPRPDGNSYGIFNNVVTWAGADLKQYLEVLTLRNPDGTTRPYTIYHPAYYQTAAIRLTLFGTAEHVPYEGVCTAVREAQFLQDVQCYKTTAEAEARLATLPKGVLYGADSLHPPVTLPKWEGLDTVYQAREKTAMIANRMVPVITVYRLRD